MGKKTTTPELFSEFIKLAKKTGIARESLEKNHIWHKRIEEVVDYLPAQTVSDLIERMQITVGDQNALTKNFAETHSLTPAEEKLLISLSEGLSVPDHAKTLAISVNTGRVHMQNILDKTGANGQLDLMRMLHKR